ncbi:MAG: hypothetical protein NTW05_24710 [Pseudonocardiales bacterium]|nr:hypothetical protein [Pseudonocardiales bacterium]
MSTSLSATIMEILERIFGEDREAFLDNPEGYLSEHGLDNISCEDFNDVFVSFLENAEFENDRGPVQLGADVEVHHSDDKDDHESIAEHLTTIIHEYGDTYVDDRDTYNDQSFNGTVIADGDVTFDNDIVNASGDGAVAAGDDIEDSNIVTGDDNVIGNNNQVGDGAFGDGAIQGGVTVDDGGAFANNGGSASGSQDDNSQDNDQDNDTEINTDNSIDVDVDDSFQDNSDNSIDTDDSFNTEVETVTDIDTAIAGDDATA